MKNNDWTIVGYFQCRVDRANPPAADVGNHAGASRNGVLAESASTCDAVSSTGDTGAFAAQKPNEKNDNQINQAIHCYRQNHSIATCLLIDRSYLNFGV